MNLPAAAEVRRGDVVLVGSAETDVVVLPVLAELERRGIGANRVDFAAARAQLPALLNEAAVLYCPGTLPVSARDIAAAGRLRAVVSIYTGTDGFDQAALSARAIVVANGQAPENTESMAEATILLILASMYDLRGAEQAMVPADAARPRRSARLVRGKTVGLIGYGQIGQAVAARLEPFGVELLISTPRPRPPYPSGAKFVTLDTLLAESDIVCMLAPLRPDTIHLLDRDRLALTKAGSVLVNVSRGPLIDEQALYELAHAGHFAAIALDVFETEPLPNDSPLRTLPNAILTPHALGHTVDSRDSLIATGIANICLALAGQRPRYVCNPDVLSRWFDAARSK